MRLDHNEIIRSIINKFMRSTCPSILSCQGSGDSINAVPKQVSGDRTERVTPVPIPNTEVKPLRADGTARATLWETRSSPGLNKAVDVSFETPTAFFFSLHKLSNSEIERMQDWSL